MILQRNLIVNEEVNKMGMTDRQFDSYQKRLLGRLEVIKEQNKEENPELDKLIREISEELQRP